MTKMSEIKLDPGKVVRYRTSKNKYSLHSTHHGIKTDDGKKLFIFKEFNVLAKTPTPINSKWVEEKINKKRARKDWCDPSRKQLTKQAADQLIPPLKGKVHTYLTMDNNGRPFLVKFNKTTALILVQPTKKLFVLQKDRIKKWTYCELVKRYDNIKKVWVGKSPLTPATKFSGGHGAKFNGNSLLIQLTNTRIVYVGEFAYEFDLMPQDGIDFYSSPVGNNSVPYPVLVGKKWVYFMSDCNAVLRRHVEDLVPIVNKPAKDIFNDAYWYFYGHHIDNLPKNMQKGNVALEKKAKSMKNRKLIRKSIW
jgi:hypothetical protein